MYEYKSSLKKDPGIKYMPNHHDSISRGLIKHPEKHHQSTKTTCVQTP